MQDRQEEPNAPSDSYIYDEQTLTPLDIMWYDEFNPRFFEAVWREFQPTGPLVDRVDSPEIQAAILEETAKSIGKQLGKLIWQGDTAAGGGSPLRFFDGFIKLFAADGDTNQVVTQGVITAANIISVLEATEAAIPSDIWSDNNVVFNMNTTDFRLYLQAARALDFKGSDIADANENRFAGRAIRWYSGMAKDNIIVTKSTSDQDSNLWAAQDVNGDDENIKMARKDANSEKFFAKVLFKYAVNFGFAGEAVQYQPV